MEEMVEASCCLGKKEGREGGREGASLTSHLALRCEVREGEGGREGGGRERGKGGRLLRSLVAG